MTSLEDLEQFGEHLEALYEQQRLLHDEWETIHFLLAIVKDNIPLLPQEERFSAELEVEELLQKCRAIGEFIIYNDQESTKLRESLESIKMLHFTIADNE